MSKPIAQIKLRQNQFGQYFKSIGFYIPKKGKRAGQRTERVWLLSKNLHEAEAEAMARMAVWHRIQQEGRNVWSEADEHAVTAITGGGIADLIRAAQAKARMRANELNAQADALERKEDEHYAALGMPTPPRAKPVPDGSPQTLYAAIDRYLQLLGQKNRADNYKRRASEVLAWLKNERPDMPLEKLDGLWLEELTDYIKYQSLNRTELKKGKQQRLSFFTIKVDLQHVRQFIEWLDEDWWAAASAKKLKKFFAVQRRDVVDAVAKRQPGGGAKVQLTVEEIKTLYGAGNGWQRLLMLMGLFCGMGQKELAVAGMEEFDLDTGLFTHKRNKTGVFGSYWLPPELVILLREELAWTAKKWDGQNPNNLAFLTIDGQPLVNDVSDSDSVAQAWDELRKKCGFRPDVARKSGGTWRGVGFYHCRSFLGDWILNNYGIELGQAALSHSALAKAPQTVLEKHYGSKKDFSDVHQAQKTLYEQLKAAGVFAV